MKVKIYAGLISVFFLVFNSASYLTAQDFTITGRTPDLSQNLTVDATQTITFDVTGVNTAGFSIIPELIISNQALAPAISATWTGTSPITGWANNTSRQISFNVHQYEDVSACGSVTGLELRFHYNGQSKAATSNNPAFLNLSTATDNVVFLEKVLSETLDPLEGELLETFAILPMLVYPATDPENPNLNLLDDPSIRLYLYIDYSAKFFHLDKNFSTFLYQIKSGTFFERCNVQLADPRPITDQTFGDVFNTAPFIDGIVFDKTKPSNPDGTRDPIQIADFGFGGGDRVDDFGLGVNLFDITDVNLSLCQGTPKTLASDDPSFLYNLEYNLVNPGSMIMREIKLYMGRQGTCSALVENFGTTPGNNFRITNFFISSEGDVSADLLVPTAWRSGSTLSPGLTVRWYLRRDDTIIDLGVNTTSLSLDVQSIGIGNPQDYYLEARVTKASTSSQVSVNNQSTAHTVAYQEGVATFEFEEPQGDDFLDPGEIITLPITITPESGPGISLGNLVPGYVIDQNGNQIIDNGDTFVDTNNGVPNDVNFRILNPINPSGNLYQFPFELVYAPNDKKVWLFVEAQYNNGGELPTYRRYIDLAQKLGVSDALNEDDRQLQFPFDFLTSSHLQDNWSTLNTNVPQGGVTGGWSHSLAAGWIAAGPTQGPEDDTLFSLQSNILPIGRDASLSFRHLPNFPFNQAGGLLEYRVLNAGGTPITSWQDLVTQVALPGQNSYHPRTFPDNFSSYLAGKRVWMNPNTSTTPTAFLNDTLTIGNFFLNQGYVSGSDQVQFRFVFQDPSLDPNDSRASSPIRWDIQNFDYSANLFVDDNFFGVDLNQLAYDGCNGTPSLVFNNLPNGITVDSLDFEWFENLGALLSGNPGTPGTPAVPFTPASNNELYFARVSLSLLGITTIRIYPVSVTNAFDCVFTCLDQVDALDQVLFDADNNWPGENSVRDYVGVLNRICTNNQ